MSESTQDQPTAPLKTPIPNILSTPERWYARLRSFYESKENVAMYAKLEPTDEEMAAYSKAYPEDGLLFEKCRLESQIVKYGTPIGTIACVAQVTRWTKTKPYYFVTGVIAGLTSLFASHTIGEWVAGTYKFDSVSLTRRYLDWVQASRAQANAKQE